MTDPVLIEVTRGSQVESRHGGLLAISDVRGNLVASVGDATRPVFPRSAIKALQVLPFVASGHAARLGYTAEEIALTCASHSGEPTHVATARGMLARVGRDEACLECGAHWPIDQEAMREMARRGESPHAGHNNCSGKHAGFVCLACAEGHDPAGYIGPDHPVQQQVRAALVEMTGAPHEPHNRGIDGCSIPTYAVPLEALAGAFARFGTGEAMPAEFAQASRMIRDAVAQAPFMVAGSGRFDTRVMTRFGERVFMKTGAEGVYCAAIPERGLGIALKCADGATRASEAIMARVLGALLARDEDERAFLEECAHAPITNWNAITVGGLRPTPELDAALAEASAGAG
ncbi:MAG: asparaginase [Salinarimonas sp.]|nr:asparaginase [Salinarimonas sp.]